jgi:hypothetical protein
VLEPKLCDFGISTYTPSWLTFISLGTPGYMPCKLLYPEANIFYNKAIDIHNIELVLVELLTSEVGSSLPPSPHIGFPKIQETEIEAVQLPYSPTLRKISKQDEWTQSQGNDQRCSCVCLCGQLSDRKWSRSRFGVISVVYIFTNTPHNLIDSYAHVHPKHPKFSHIRSSSPKTHKSHTHIERLPKHCIQLITKKYITTTSTHFSKQVPIF